ncbi:MAG: hypothetical protein ACD_79C00865G0001 [uncultured bacterium]|nr:MAG: hypothetical protein ACD_79C00865G0001 [uncultured bacterium]
MAIPKNPNISFFDYGLFKPGEIGYLQISDYVEDVISNVSITGDLLDRGGIPVLDDDGLGKVNGFIIIFKKEFSKFAYEKILSEDLKQFYKWKSLKTYIESHQITIEHNVLCKISKKNSFNLIKEGSWQGNRSSLFKEGLETVKEYIDSTKSFNLDERCFVKLQMAYFLLWTIIDFHVFLRYQNLSDSKLKLQCLADDKIFNSAFKSVVKDNRFFYNIFHSEEYILNPGDVLSSLEYYYQQLLSMNSQWDFSSHNFTCLKKSLNELYNVFVKVKYQSFKDSLMLKEKFEKLSKEKVEKIASFLKAAFKSMSDSERRNMDIDLSNINWENVAKHILDK